MLSSLELAKLCGVSQGTVDRALHDRPGISEKTKQRILQAALKHGYVPNPSAHEMIRGQSSVVGAIMPALNSLFFSDLFEHLHHELHARGIRLTVAAASDEADFIAALQDFAARRCRAAVVIPPAEHLDIPATLTGRMPVISFASSLRGTNTHFLAPDEVLTGRRATDYLYAQGHRRIAHVTYKREAQGIRDRRAGYEQQMRALGLEPLVLADTPDQAMVRELQRHGITAVFAHNDWLAMAMLRQVQQAGLRVPHDLSLLGVDDSPTFTRIFPDLTTMHYPFEELARRACALIMNSAQPDASPLMLTVVERATVPPLNPKATL